jgi:hypothetical protein
MLDKSYYHLRKYLAANFKCDLGCPNIKTTLEALDACNFIAAYQEIGKMTSQKMQNAIVTGMVIQNDPVMDIKLRACKCLLSLAEANEELMEYAVNKNLDFACCSRSSYGNCLIALLANIVPADYDQTVLKQIIKLSKAMYRTDYDKERIDREFPQSSDFMKKCVDNSLTKKVQKDAEILENEWIS